MSDKDITIRFLRLADLDGIEALYAEQVGNDTDPFGSITINGNQLAWEMRRFRQKMLADQRYIAYVATVDNGGSEEIVGYMAAAVEYQAAFYRVQTYASIGECWVRPEYRGRGVGTALAEGIMESVAELGLDWVTVSFNIADAGLLRFFESCGFRKSSLEMRCHLEMPVMDGGQTDGGQPKAVSSGP